jgi:putative polyhydroxyalkanoate system protein
MAGFKISKTCTMPKEEVRQAAEKLAAQLEKDHGVRSRWDGDTVHIKGAGIDGCLCMEDDRLDVSVKLGMLASMFESPLRREIQRYLDEYVT